MKTLVYLATPYTYDDPYVMEERFRVVNRVASELMSAGVHVFSPISHTRPIALAGDLPHGWDYWRAYDYAILQCCSKMIVLMQYGWSFSKGVKGEVEIAMELGIPVEYMAFKPDSN